ncbi:hypothetical protein [Porphyromonas sp. COT-108 OH1349]|uniref:hypothetical protein n=1 Tax=Porphyromonas sp. COT-108 OH1349 TaxID=1537504 RepID=UPI00052C7CC9|nr:hypothetical protein [Porphyromonas sp. COT-108 OH1349]KGN67500.1 hypothetical protein JT26_09805 [Porphyromonas sp. COT-108 OH1349]
MKRRYTSDKIDKVLQDATEEVSLLSAVKRYSDVYEAWLLSPLSQGLTESVEISFEGDDTILIICKSSVVWHRLNLSKESLRELFDETMREHGIKKIELKRV